MTDMVTLPRGVIARLMECAHDSVTWRRIPLVELIKAISSVDAALAQAGQGEAVAWPQWTSLDDLGVPREVQARITARLPELFEGEPAPPPSPAVPDSATLRRLEAKAHEWVKDYMFDSGEGFYRPKEHERMLLLDCILGLIAEVEDDAPPPAPAVPSEPVTLTVDGPGTVTVSATGVRFEAAEKVNVRGAPPAPAVPVGWVMVPREPTEAMCKSAWRIEDPTPAGIWAAMIHAAPPPPQQGETK